MGYFSEEDRALIEGLSYQPTLEPNYEVIKSCLIWPDEEPHGISADGYERLGDLWVARSFIHREVPFSSWEFNPTYFEDVWNSALADGFRWPGFRRLELGERDKAYLQAETERLAQMSEL